MSFSKLVWEPFVSFPVTFSDVCVGPEGEGFLSGFIQCEEGQQAEMPRDRAWTEEGGVRPTWEPAEEGYSDAPSAYLFWIEVVWNQSRLIAWKWNMSVQVWHVSWVQKHALIIKHGFIKSQRGDTHTVQRETRHKLRILTSWTLRFFAFPCFPWVWKRVDCVSLSMCASISHILSHGSQ